MNLNRLGDHSLDQLGIGTKTGPFSEPVQGRLSLKKKLLINLKIYHGQLYNRSFSLYISSHLRPNVSTE